MGALALLLALILLLPAGCAPQEAAEGTAGYGVWFAVRPGGRGGAAVFAERRHAPETAELVPWLMEALLRGPEDLNLRSPFPADVTLRNWRQEEGVLYLDLSEQYGGLSGIELTLADYCITLTLGQIEDVDSVAITADGRALPTRARQALRPEDVILSGSGETPVYISAVLYFPRTAGKGLGVEPRSILLREGDTLAAAVAAALLAGPETDTLRTLIPADTQLLSVAVSDRVCYIDVSAALLDGLPEAEEEVRLLLYSFVDTLGNLENVDAVQLLVNGQTLQTLGALSANKPLEPDFRLTESN